MAMSGVRGSTSCTMGTFLKKQSNTDKQNTKNKRWSDTSGLIMLNVLSMKTFCHIVIQHDFPTYVYIAMLYMLMYLSYQLPNALIAIHYRDSASVIPKCCISLYRGLDQNVLWIYFTV